MHIEYMCDTCRAMSNDNDHLMCIISWKVGRAGAAARSAAACSISHRDQSDESTVLRRVRRVDRVSSSLDGVQKWHSPWPRPHCDLRLNGGIASFCHFHRSQFTQSSRTQRESRRTTLHPLSLKAGKGVSLSAGPISTLTPRDVAVCGDVANSCGDVIRREIADTAPTTAVRTGVHVRTNARTDTSH